MGATTLAALCALTWATQAGYIAFLLADGHEVDAGWIPFAAVAGMATACAFVALSPHMEHTHARQAIRFGISLWQMALWPSVAYTVGALDVYIVAFFATWVPLNLVDTLDKLELVPGQRVQTLEFARAASMFYACTRSWSAALQREFGGGSRVDRYVPIMLANAETIGMVAVDSKTYAFRRHQVGFIVYATVKSAVFLCLPAVEERILNAVRA